MVLRILRFLAILAVALFALRAYAHQIECEKEVGVVQLDAEGRVVLGTDGLPVFTSPPSTILTLDTYPVAIGWRVQVSNLTDETSFISGFEDPYLAGLGQVEVFGTVPADGVGIPVGESIEMVVVERIGSFDQCLGLPQGVAGALVEGAPVCREARENVAFITTHADATGCRAKVICEPEEPALPATCETVSGIHWCYNPQLCGTGCTAVCASLGMTITISDADWLAAQDTTAECMAIGAAFGLGGVLTGSGLTCIEDVANDHSAGTLMGQLFCSTAPGCPTNHRTGTDNFGVPCTSPTPSRLAVCPCSPVLPLPLLPLLPPPPDLITPLPPPQDPPPPELSLPPPDGSLPPPVFQPL